MRCFSCFYGYNGCTFDWSGLQCLIPGCDSTKTDGTMCPKKLHVVENWGNEFGWGGVLSNYCIYLDGWFIWAERMGLVFAIGVRGNFVGMSEYGNGMGRTRERHGIMMHME